MTKAVKVVGRGRKKKQESIENSPAPLRKKRGRKHRSRSPASPNPSSISFFKVMVGDFKDVLYIPPMAACTLKGLDKKNVYIEDANGKYWNVKMSMIGGSLAFQKGWDDFFSSHSITVGEFVLFTYSGGLLFTARIFGTSSLERVDFQKQKRRGKCGNERCTSELKPNNVRPYKRKKASNASEDKLSPSDIKPLSILRGGKEAAQFDFPNIQVVEIDPICEVLKVPSLCEEPLQCDSNSKESENVPNSSEQTWHKNVNATVEEVETIEEVNIISPIEQAKLGADNREVEKAASLFHSGVAVVSEQETKLGTMIKAGTLALKAHSDINEELLEMTSEGLLEMTLEGLPEMTSEGLPEMTSELLPEMESKGLLEMTSKGLPEMISVGVPEMTYEGVPEITSEGLAEMTFEVLAEMTSEELPEMTSEGLPEMTSEELPEMTSEGLPEMTTEGLPEMSSERLPEMTSEGLPETISVVSSNSILICDSNKKDNLMPTNGECGNPQIKGSSTIAESCLQSSTKVHECKYRNSPEIGIGHDAFIDVDENDDTPCSSCRSRAITERRDSVVDFQSSNCASFSVCLSNDVQSSLELPKELASQMGKKLKNERKIVVLQDLSMKCWPVLYHQNLNFIGFIGGWVDFARANDICRGDICEFELVNKTEFKFRVQITKQEGSVFDQKAVDGSTD